MHSSKPLPHCHCLYHLRSAHFGSTEGARQDEPFGCPIDVGAEQ